MPIVYTWPKSNSRGYLSRLRIFLCILAALPLISIFVLSLHQQRAVQPPPFGPRCIGWRGTFGCNPLGVRDFGADRACDQEVHGTSGYCLCEGNITVARFSCGPHKFTCKAKCAELGNENIGALQLPKPLACSSTDAYNWTEYLSPASVPPLDDVATDIVNSKNSRKVWDLVDQLMVQHGLHDVEMPPSRVAKRDWVMEGTRLKRSEQDKIKSKVDQLKAAIPPYPSEYFSGRGVVLVGGGLRYIIPAWVTVHVLRRSGCHLPIEMWFPVEEYPTRDLEMALNTIGVTCRRLDQRDLGQRGFTIKVAALMLSRFQEVIFMDADNVVLRDPTYLLESEPYIRTGSLFWQDYWDRTSAPQVADILNITRSQLPKGSFESGQMVVDKARHWHGLVLSVYFNTYATTFYELLSCFIGKGDKETFAYGMMAAGEPIWLQPTPPGSAGFRMRLCKPRTSLCEEEFCGNTMVQHDDKGEAVFFHANYQKFHLQLPHHWEDYHRRWQLMQPGNVDLVQWITTYSGFDIELYTYQLLKAFRCAPWFSHYYRSRIRLGDKPAPDLDGFHPMSDSLVFRTLYRRGWGGNYEHTIFEPSPDDRWSHWYFGGLRWKMLPYERPIKAFFGIRK